MFAFILLSEEGSNMSLVWLLYIVLMFLLLMIIVGWLVGRKEQGQLEGQHEAKKSAKKDADDLAKIEGIGPKVVRVLKDAGITTYDELAHAKIGRIQEVLDAAGLQMMNPKGWIAQAKLAAQDDWKGFEKLQSELKAGQNMKR
jgi:hypothetical protein